MRIFIHIHTCICTAHSIIHSNIIWVLCTIARYVMISSYPSLSLPLPYSVVFYSCPRLAVDCSTCIGLNDNFNCAYCTSTDSGSCMLSTLTCSPGPLIRPLNSTCPTPMITEVRMFDIFILLCSCNLWSVIFSPDLSISWSC